METTKYWQREMPKIKIFGKTRFAYYEKAGVLQVSALHQEIDGTLRIGKTIPLFEDTVIDRESLATVDFLIDILHLWRKRGRARLNPIAPMIDVTPIVDTIPLVKEHSPTPSEPAIEGNIEPPKPDAGNGTEGEGPADLT